MSAIMPLSNRRSHLLAVASAYINVQLGPRILSPFNVSAEARGLC
jgi:hypothetical protein